MTKTVNHVSHIKSKQKVNGKPKLPSASAITEGEIAINYAKNVETLSIKNESGTVVTFSSDDYYTEQKLGSGFTGSNSAKTVTEIIESNERVIASAFLDIKDSLSGKVDTSDLGSMAYENTSSYSSATEVNTALNIPNFHYCTCSTAAGTAEKTIVVADSTDFVLRGGAVIMVLFDNTNTASTPSFNVANTSAHAVQQIAQTDEYKGGKANRYQLYYYDPSNAGTWVYIGVIEKTKDFKVLGNNDSSITLDKDIHYYKTLQNSSFTIALPNNLSDGDVLEISVSVSGNCSVTVPVSIVWANGNIPTFESDKMYEINIKIMQNVAYGVFAEYEI